MSIEAPIKLGIGPEALLARNPRLIYAQASGWGRKGPDANELSFDYTGIARSGMICPVANGELLRVKSFRESATKSED